MTTGKRLASFRKEYGYTQETLGEHLGVSKQAVSKWESDITYPETDKLILLAKLYNCSIDYLLCNDISGNEDTIIGITNKSLTTGLIIANKRKEYGYTQESLGEKLGVTRQAVSKWESDITFPETDKLILLSELFNSSIDYLLCNNKYVSEDKKIINKIFPTIWSVSFFLITLLLYLFPYYRLMLSGFDDIIFNVYEMLFPSLYGKGNVLVSLSYDLSNIFVLLAFICQMLMMLIGIVLLFNKDKRIIKIRFICSIIESSLWIIHLILGLYFFQIGMVLLVLSSVANLLGLVLIKYNRYNETKEDDVIKPQNKRFYTLLYGIISYILLVVFYTFPFVNIIRKSDTTNIFGLIISKHIGISLSSIMIIGFNYLMLIMSIIIYIKNNKLFYIIRFIGSIISFVVSIILFIILVNQQTILNYNLELGVYYFLIMQLIIPLGLLFIKNNRFINEQ